MELLKLVFERAEALNDYWNLYIAVSLGVLGLMASGKPFTRELTTKRLLTIGFIVFAGSNLNVLYSTNLQREALVALVSSEYKDIANNAAPPPFTLDVSIFSFRA